MQRQAKVEYTYDGDFGIYGIADRARAYSGATLIAEAQAKRIIEKEPGPNCIEVEEVHFSKLGTTAYEGTITFQFGFGGGTVVDEKAIKGRKELNIFRSWPSGP